jgi:hypothetical protein
MMLAPVRLIVCGGRYFADWILVNRALSKFFNQWHKDFFDIVVAHGGCRGLSALHTGRGADAIAHRWCLERQVPVLTWPASWACYGQRAGPLRNSLLVERFQPTHFMAFQGGAGTADMRRKCLAAGALEVALDSS